MKFPKGNKIKFWQDDQLLFGVPFDIEWEFVAIGSHWMKLKSSGYGGEPYGVGPITVLFQTPRPDYQHSQRLEVRRDFPPNNKGRVYEESNPDHAIESNF